MNLSPDLNSENELHLTGFLQSKICDTFYHRTMIKGNIFIVIFAWLATLVVSLLYTSYFHMSLDAGDWFDLGGVTRIVIPDTFVYREVLNEDFSQLGFAIAGVKNAIGPALIWTLASSNWYAVAFINSLFLLGTLLYTAKLATYFGVSTIQINYIILLLGLMPAMTYYSIGALKELPTLFLITGFYYHFVKKQTFFWVTMTLILIGFRFQLIPVFMIYILIDKFSKNPLRMAAMVLLIGSMAYPFISQMNVFSSEATLIFREESGSSLGGAIENVLDTIPIVSSIAVFIRVFQSILEPLATFFKNWSFFEDGSFSILAFVYFTSLLITLPSWWRTLLRAYKFIRKKRHSKFRGIDSLYGFILLFTIPVGGFSFIHHRYLFPITALIMIAGAKYSRNKPRK